MAFICTDPSTGLPVEGCTTTKHKSKGMCEKHYRRWKKHGTLDIPDDTRPRRGMVINTEEGKPEEAAEAIVAAEEPFTTLAQAAEQTGFPRKTLEAMMRRIKAQHQPLHEELKNLSTTDMVRQLDQKIGMTLGYIDDFVLSGASFRDLTIGLGILIEKKQLLSGEPTQILTIEERKNLTQLMPALFQEVSRRGITIDQTPDEPVRTLLPQAPQKEALSATARRVKPEEVEKAL